MILRLQFVVSILLLGNSLAVNPGLRITLTSKGLDYSERAVGSVHVSYTQYGYMIKVHEFLSFLLQFVRWQYQYWSNLSLLSLSLTFQAVQELQ